MSCLWHELLTISFHRLGQVACTASPGRPFVCVDPQTRCPSVCEPGFKACGLQRVDGRFVIGPGGLPLPNCVPADQAGTMCDQTNIRPLPANFTGGDGLGRWDPVRLNGTSDGQSDVGVIAEIGSEAFAGGPTFFGGNGSDPTIVVKVRNNALSTLFISYHEFSTVRRYRSCRFYNTVQQPSSLFLNVCQTYMCGRFGPFANQINAGRLLSSVLSVTPSSPIRSVPCIQFQLSTHLCIIVSTPKPLSTELEFLCP